MSDDLVKRMRECTIPDIRNFMKSDHLKPAIIDDVYAAASHIEAQAARIERLEAALRELLPIAARNEPGAAVSRAQSLLAKIEKEEGK